MACSLVGYVSSVKSEFKWNIENFCTGCINVGDFLSSPEFTTLNDGILSRWQLRIYPKGRDESCRNHLSIYLQILTDANITVDASFAILHGDQKKVAHQRILGEKTFNKDLMWGFPSFMYRSFVMNTANNILVDDRLTIICEISANPIESTNTEEEEEETECADETKTCQPEHTEEEKNRVRLLEFDTFELMITEEDRFSDVTFKIGKQTWKAHKCILARRSPVLAAMFEAEIKDGVVEIKDVEPNLFMEILRFAYSGKVNDIENIAGELLILAKKYNLDTLFEMCEKTLCENLDIDNIVESLKLAHKYKVLNLKKAAVDFFVSNGKNIVDRPNFKDLMDVPGIMYEVLHRMVSRDTDEKMPLTCQVLKI